LIKYCRLIEIGIAIYFAWVDQWSFIWELDFSGKSQFGFQKEFSFAALNGSQTGHYF
jgi:hypothetical protein